MKFYDIVESFLYFTTYRQPHGEIELAVQMKHLKNRKTLTLKYIQII